MAPFLTETNLLGYLDGSITSDATSIDVKFYDKVTGEAREPQSTTLLFVIDKGTQTQPNPNYEIIYATSHSTTDGVTTLTGVTRGVSFYGNTAASVAARKKPHVSSSEIGCADVHLLWNNANAKVAGSENFDTDIEFDPEIKINLGGTDSYVTSSADGEDLILKDANNSETTLSELTAAAGTDEKAKISTQDTTPGFLHDKIIGGAGISSTIKTPAGDETMDLDIDTTDTNVFVETTSGSSDEGKIAILDENGVIKQENVEILEDVTASAAQINELPTLTDGSEADDLHTHKPSKLEINSGEFAVPSLAAYVQASANPETTDTDTTTILKPDNGTTFVCSAMLNIGDPTGITNGDLFFGLSASNSVVTDVTAYTTAHFGVGISDNGSNKYLYFTNADGSTQTTTQYGTEVSDGDVYQLVMEYTSTEIKYYLNGSLEATHTTNIPTIPSNSTYVLASASNSTATNAITIVAYPTFRMTL